MSYQPPPDPYQFAGPQPSGPAGQYSPDGRWFWDGRQFIPVTVPWPTWARPYAPPENPSAAAVALVALASAGSVLTIVYLITTLATAPGSRVSVPEAIIFLVALATQSAGLIGSVIAVPIWMHRVYGNLPALGEQGMQWSPAWAAGGWFIPFVNLVVPYLIIREVWSCFGDARPLPQPWWAAAIAYVALGSVGGDRLGPLLVFSRSVGDVLVILGELASILAAFLLITMIRRISRRERDRYGQLQTR